MQTRGSMQAEAVPNPVHDLFHVVLVEPKDSLNIGSVARAMMNLGFRNLHLVNPLHRNLERAALTARWAVDLVREATVHQSLEAALENMQEVVGFSDRGGKNRPADFGLEEWLTRQPLQSGQLTDVRTALVFGPEDHGLTQEHVRHCRWLIKIPSSDHYPAYNLAQSVLVALYEINRLTRVCDVEPLFSEAPSWNSYEQLNRMVHSILERCGYYTESTPAPIADVVRNIFHRTQVDEREMRILLGLFARIEGTLSGRYRQLPPKDGLVSSENEPNVSSI